MQARERIDIPMDALADLCRRYHVRELALFGSVLRDDFRDDSDIDILVEYESDAQVGLYEHFDLQRDLEQLLGRRVDLVSKRGLNVVIRDDVLRSSQVLYAA
jgi:predicted nucleotidyltransferase